jgi:hypothetical protein
MVLCELGVGTFEMLLDMLLRLPWLFHTLSPLFVDLALSMEALASIILPVEALDFLDATEGEAMDLWGRGRDDFRLEVSTSEDDV